MNERRTPSADPLPGHTDPSEARVNRALHEMTDGLLLVDSEWRIFYANAAAERLLATDGPTETPLGHLLWEAARELQGDGVVEGLFRHTAAAGLPGGFDVKRPTDGRWYHLRLGTVPDGTAVYISDVTESKAREAEAARAHQAAVEQAERIRDLTISLSGALTVQDVVSAVAQRVLPPFGASGLTIGILEEARLNCVRIVGAIGYPESFTKMVEAEPVTAVSPVSDVLNSGVPLFIDTAQEHVRRYPHMAHRIDASGKKSWAFLPLIASGRPIGACSISFTDQRRLDETEQTLLTALSGLIAQALERARLHDADHVRARELQRGLLPRSLPVLPSLTAAARYIPAGEAADVGGDWYDVLPLSSGRVALVIGDVMGHGLSEAATMGRLRTAVHTLADLELSPDDLLAHLNDLVAELGEDFYATCLYAVYDPTDASCTFAAAGHPPPVVVDPQGMVRFLDLEPNSPLGVADPPFETTQLHVPDGSLLVFYTDGLTGTATRTIDRGMTLLTRALSEALEKSDTDGGTAASANHAETRHVVHAAPDPLLERLCDALTTNLLPSVSNTTDDAALLIARLHSLDTADMASWTLPEEPRAAGQARALIREQLADWDLEALVMTTELIVSELVTNAVRYGRGPIRLRLLRSDYLVCEVADGSLTTPHVRRAIDTDEGGRGLQLVTALAHRWGARYETSGKYVWSEQQLPEAMLM
ncbi:SpoIIE family protein phosphatase [Streptomyces sp. NPDC005078]|uniref:ATP-binding SpoIIE family protein phosphatase n=1 Tax=unclassified Streptomyces TaxID=2593676 RepID=UPI0033BDEBA7